MSRLRAILADANRYEDLGPIGAGGMGEVRRVRDRDLQRVMVMKTLRADLASDGQIVARFIEEAQITAQLQHPNIVPVHEFGQHPDGRYYFTMKEVRGTTLREKIKGVHLASSPTHWGTTPDGWSFRRLIVALHSVCEAVAYAHARGVIHQDLKPQNVLVGDYGEVVLMDWGLARAVPQPEGSLEQPVSTEGGLDVPWGLQIAGTPGYMSPEQEAGDPSAISVRSDVYALGAMLYEVLSGSRPRGAAGFGGLAQKKVQTTFTFDAPSDDHDTVGRELPPELIAASERAMAQDPDARFAEATELAEEIVAWIDGARRRGQALAQVEDAAEFDREAEGHRARARVLRRQARALLDRVSPWQGERHKADGWRREDEAKRLDQRARVAEMTAARVLHAALTIDAELPEAHEALATRAKREHAEAEQLRDSLAQERALIELQVHTAALPASPARDRFSSYLRGDGQICVHTQPRGARVSLHRFVERGRRLHEEDGVPLGRTPLNNVPLPMGSYCLHIQADRHELIRYPVLLRRQECWDGVAPGDAQATVIALPPLGSLDDGDRYVPAGYFLAGGDPEPDTMPRQRVWCDGFVIKRDPVTNADYLAFLNDLVGRGRQELAARCAPANLHADGSSGPPLLGQGSDGRYILGHDVQGDLWRPEAPVVMVDWVGIVAYTRWFAAISQQPWRLPWELEWEKAARGVDGRLHPWGDALDPSWLCMRDSRPADQRGPALVGAFPIDTSPYGVRGLAGNSCDWCRDVGHARGPRIVRGRVQRVDEPADAHTPRVQRGGAWGANARSCRVSRRWLVRPGDRRSSLGFRMVRSWPED